MKISNGPSLVLIAMMPLIGNLAYGQVAPTYSDASLKGTYVGAGSVLLSKPIQHILPGPLTARPASPLGFESSGAAFVFDGAGNFSGPLFHNDDGSITSTTATGTYSVAVDGAFTLNAGDVLTGSVVESGAIALIYAGTAGTHPQIIVLVRQLGPDDNTSAGADALISNTTGIENTTTGAYSMYKNSTGNFNNAAGYQALYGNTTGFGNAADGYQALFTNSQGNNNTAFGYQVLYSNSTGVGNAGQGAFALQHNSTGSGSTGLGNHALQFSNGSRNAALGFYAGFTLTSGSNNIDIGNPGGAAGESSTIRIGTTPTTTAGNVLAPHTATYIAGITGTQVTGAAVYVTASGQLGVLASSERYKTDIAPIASSPNKLRQLRPVSYHLKTEPKGDVQYGLIAEEVDQVYPELVIRDESGKVQGVRYEELTPMLLAEMQQQQQLGAAQAAKIEAQDQHAATLDAEISALTGQLTALHAALAAMQTRDQGVAHR